MRNIYYLHGDTDRIKTTQHCQFDEGMNDLSSPPPNACRLRQSMGYDFSPETDEISASDSLCLKSTDTPFHDTVECTVPIVCEDPIF